MSGSPTSVWNLAAISSRVSVTASARIACRVKNHRIGVRMVAGLGDPAADVGQESGGSGRRCPSCQGQPRSGRSGLYPKMKNPENEGLGDEGRSVKSHRQVCQARLCDQQRPQGDRHRSHHPLSAPRRRGHRRPHAAQTGGHPRGRRGPRSPNRRPRGVLGVCHRRCCRSTPGSCIPAPSPDSRRGSIIRWSPRRPKARLAVDTSADEDRHGDRRRTAVSGDYDEVFADILTVREAIGRGRS